MTNKKYQHKFRDLKDFSLSDVKEVTGKINEAVLNIDSCGVQHRLTLESPIVPGLPSTTVKDLFSALKPESVDSFIVLEKQDNLWLIEIWKGDGPLKNHTIHCRNIQDLPSKEDKKG